MDRTNRLQYFVRHKCAFLALLAFNLVVTLTPCLAQLQSEVASPFKGISGPARLERSNGVIIDGKLITIGPRGLRIRVGATTLSLRAEDVKAIYVSGDIITYNRHKGVFQSAAAIAREAKLQPLTADEEARLQRLAAHEEAKKKRLAAEEEVKRQRIAAEAPRRGRVKVVNCTLRPVDFVLSGFRDPEGDDTDQVDAEIGRIWNVPPKEAVYITGFGKDLVTSRVSYTLTSTDGTTLLEREKTNPGAEFVVTIEDRDLHSPVLVKVGAWSLKQDALSLGARYKTPVTLERVSENRYEVTGGEEYEHTKKVLSDVVTASADVENPTNQSLDVAVTLELDHIDGSSQRASETTKIPPRTTTRMHVTIILPDDGGASKRITLFDNLRMAFGQDPLESASRVARVRVVDITTTPSSASR